MKNIFGLLTILALCAMFGDCTKRPSPEQLSALEEAKAAANAAEREVASLENELSELKGDLQREKEALAENESDRELIKSNLGK